MIDILFDIKCLELGIAPIRVGVPPDFSSLSPAQQKACKRKFRKIKRRLAKKTGRRVFVSDIRAHIRAKAWREYFSAI